jgi:hypothetical protein
MNTTTVDVAFLQEFEQELNPRYPEQSKIPAQVLGYGEISTVFSIEAADPGLAYKRIPSFHSAEEAADYVALYDDCMAVFDDIGIEIAPGEMVWFEGVNGRYFVVYLIQKMLNPQTIAHKVIHQLDVAQAHTLIAAIFDEFEQVFAFNAENQGSIEVGFDGQLSNWAVSIFDAENGNLPDPVNLVYLDTSSPLLRRNGVEQLNAEIFLRSAPAFLQPILKALFLEDVVTRYYDLRKVTIDLLANLYKEQKAELVPSLLNMANERWGNNERFTPLTPKEIESYYREDAFIWRLYLGARRFDRALHQLFNKPYPFILPGKIER